MMNKVTFKWSVSSEIELSIISKRRGITCDIVLQAIDKNNKHDWTQMASLWYANNNNSNMWQKHGLVLMVMKRILLN